MTKLEKNRKLTAEYLTRPVINLLARTPITPNTLTWLGFWITAGASVLVVTDNLFAAGFVVLAAGLFDMMDGGLARATKRVTRFGGILDSTLDRLSEALLLLGLLYMYASQAQAAYSLVAGLALVFSLMVSYIRARVEGAGLDCKVGFFTRPERVVIMALGLIFSRFDYVLIGAIGLIALLSFATVVQRLVHARRVAASN